MDLIRELIVFQKCCKLPNYVAVNPLKRKKNYFHYFIFIMSRSFSKGFFFVQFCLFGL